MTNDEKITIIEKTLPQTQCDLCGYGGCKPYATAMVNDDAPIDQCPPGNVDTLKQLSKLTQKPYENLLTEFVKTVKQPSTVVIREEECIGCTKCITACPVDAIIGSAKQLHTVITDECTGCDLCIPACPVDCMDSVNLKQANYTKEKAKSRFEAKQTRIEEIKQQKREAFQAKKAGDKSDYMANLLKKKRKEK